VNTRLLLKMIFVLAVLLFMVMMGKQNNDPVRFKLPSPVRYTSEPVESCYMYFTFFGVGLITGGVIAAGVGKKAGSSQKSK